LTIIEGFFFVISGDQEVTEVNDLSAGNIPNLEVAIVTKADDNGAIYRCEASNKATDSPLVALRKLTVHCKYLI
jgi:hypothetical protein